MKKTQGDDEIDCHALCLSGSHLLEAHTTTSKVLTKIEYCKRGGFSSRRADRAVCLP
jgi:hypothetical protein